MANATISELAKVVGVAVEKLLSQVKEAGLPHTEAGDVISRTRILCFNSFAAAMGSERKR